MAKGTSTTVGTLNLNESGGLVKIGSGGLETSGSVIISTTGKGHYLKDSSGYSYPGVYDNGANLWLGATATAAKHHKGSTYISSGYNGTSGNRSIFVSVPNNTNDNANNYEVFHTNNYGNWAVKLDGSNVTAGKTWGINISGKAATADNATNATNAANAVIAASFSTSAGTDNVARHVFFANSSTVTAGTQKACVDDDFKYNPSTNVLTVTSISGSAAKLTTPRAINGTNFDGSAAITTAKWGTARTISISSTAGTTGTSIDGSGSASLIIPKAINGFTSIVSDVFNVANKVKLEYVTTTESLDFIFI